MDKKEQSIALFRYRIIAPLLQESGLKQKSYFKKAAEKAYEYPHYGLTKFKAATFKKWLHLYRKYGFEGLIPSYRKDKGISRKVTPEIIEKIKTLSEEYNFHTIKNLYDYMIMENYIQEDDFTYATLTNFINANDIFSSTISKKARKSFEVEHVNKLWMCDFMYGPYVQQGKRKIKTYLCAIIDDHARFIIGAQFYDTMSNKAFELTLKNAISTYGSTNKLYCDNGKVFLQGHLSIIAAKLGMVIVHSKPGDPSSRGKIERLFRSIRSSFIPFFHIKYKSHEKTLETLNKEFHIWISQKYHQKIHSSIKSTPYDRYFKNAQEITIRRPTPKEINEAFMHIIYRKVNNDSTVQILTYRYEVPPKYIGHKIQIRYSIDSPEELYLFENNTQIYKLLKVNKNKNSDFPIRFRDDEDDTQEACNV